MRQKPSPTVARVCLTLLTVLSCSATALAQKLHARDDGYQHSPVPFIDIASPTAAAAHGSGFILILDGAGFGPNAEIGFQLGSINHPLPTLVVNAGEVAAYVPAALLTHATTASITVTNHDGHSDSLASNAVQLPINKPTASVTFNQTNITLGQGPGGIVTADFNADGQPDLAITEPCGADLQCSTYNGNLSVLLGRGNGTFVALPQVAVGNFPGALATGDFNGDGKIDLAVANYTGSSVTILFNDGLGGFTVAPATVPVDINPNSIGVGDFNRDGKLDLAVSNGNTTAVAILLGRGNGTFAAAASPTVPDTAQSVTVADLNRDGILDLLVDTNVSPYVYVFLGHGNGTFSVIASPSTAISGSTTLGDVNGDGRLDLVFTLGNSPGFAQTTLSTALGNGNGLFHAGPTSPFLNEGLFGGTLADLNGDGKLDYAGEVGYPSNSYDFLLGDGHGTFNLNNSINVSDEFNGPAAIADFNGDGKLDLATLNGVNNGTISILLQQ